MRYASGRDEQDNAIDVRDPLSEKFKQLSAKAGASVQQLVADFLAITEIFGNDLPRNEPFRDTVAAHLATLLDAGSKATVRRVVEATRP
jgi:mannitol-1-phosphate/altronate dehydrogenase